MFMYRTFKKKQAEQIFVGILKVNDEDSRIRIH
jgi:hypothetical protein